MKSRPWETTGWDQCASLPFDPSSGLNELIKLNCLGEASMSDTCPLSARNMSFPSAAVTPATPAPTCLAVHITLPVRNSMHSGLPEYPPLPV